MIETTGPTPLAPANHPRPRRRLGRLTGLVLASAILFYLLSPYYSFWRFTEALKSGDKESLSERVDFPSIRASLKKQLGARFAPEQPPAGKRHAFSILSPSVIDALIDALVTPEGLAALIAKPQSAGDVAGYVNNQRMPKGFDWGKVRYAFFRGVRDFEVDVEGTRLHFRFTGSAWRLQKIDLPIDQLKR